ncbi:glycosyltransferase involved in cell wall biosynthesis [Sinorhizobium kostiense]|uniref:Glycosyltransferase involved in cell wall biosynthesis n=1 Tax=Sinorhizobium kostiense TaxID=76747 RepID=A0ABS4QSQ0_9HYPH|nr:glycosyltransferase family 2 protein [Sinorhizobium kostiense]MBP2233690.1 glycosyltransferase involved in cell wall biosynthesis [Sinorhizobium kostiense]
MFPIDVTVVIPVFNRSHTLLRALTSVIAQTQHPREVIVVDDGSSVQDLAEIRSIIAKFSETLHISLLINEINRGANYSRNRGIFQAKGAYIAFLDSDDLWLPEKLATQMEQIHVARQRDKRPILSSTGRYRVNSKGDIIARQPGARPFNPAIIRGSNVIGTLSSVIVDTSIAQRIGGFDERLPACQDWDFFIRLAEYVQFVGVPDTLCVYVDHDSDRISLNHRNRVRAHIHILQKYHTINKSSCSVIYKNIAEAYQEVGEQKKADIYLAKSFANYVCSSLYFRYSLEYFFYLYFRIRPSHSLRAKRYIGYRKAMKRAMANPQVLAKIRYDAARLKEMMLEQRDNAVFSKSRE